MGPSSGHTSRVVTTSCSMTQGSGQWVGAGQQFIRMYLIIHVSKYNLKHINTERYIKLHRILLTTLYCIKTTTLETWNSTSGLIEFVNCCFMRIKDNYNSSQLLAFNLLYYQSLFRMVPLHVSAVIMISIQWHSKVRIGFHFLNSIGIDMICVVCRIPTSTLVALMTSLLCMSNSSCELQNQQDAGIFWFPKQSKTAWHT